MRDIHRFLRVFVPVAGGIFLILSELIVPSAFRFAVIVGVGIAMVVVGSWRLFYSFLPDERRFTALREEVNTFLETVRQLNAVAYAARQEAHVWYPQAIQDLKAALHDCVERIAEVAGVPAAMHVAESVSLNEEAPAETQETAPATATS